MRRERITYELVGGLISTFLIVTIAIIYVPAYSHWRGYLAGFSGVVIGVITAAIGQHIGGVVYDRRYR